jgi:hypothetical protein
MSPTNTPSVTSLRLDRFLAALKYVLPAAPKGEDNALMARVCFRGDRIWAGDDYRLLMARVEGANFRPVAWDGGAARRLCALLTAMRSDLQPELLVDGLHVECTNDLGTYEGQALSHSHACPELPALPVPEHAPLLGEGRVDAELAKQAGDWKAAKGVAVTFSVRALDDGPLRFDVFEGAEQVAWAVVCRQGGSLKAVAHQGALFPEKKPTAPETPAAHAGPLGLPSGDGDDRLFLVVNLPWWKLASAQLPAAELAALPRALTYDETEEAVFGPFERGDDAIFQLKKRLIHMGGGPREVTVRDRVAAEAARAAEVEAQREAADKAAAATAEVTADEGTVDPKKSRKRGKKDKGDGAAPEGGA